VMKRKTLYKAHRDIGHIKTRKGWGEGHANPREKSNNSGKNPNVAKKKKKNLIIGMREFSTDMRGTWGTCLAGLRGFKRLCFGNLQKSR